MYIHYWQKERGRDRGSWKFLITYEPIWRCANTHGVWILVIVDVWLPPTNLPPCRHACVSVMCFLSAHAYICAAKSNEIICICVICANVRAYIHHRHGHNINKKAKIKLTLYSVYYMHIFTYTYIRKTQACIQVCICKPHPSIQVVRILSFWNIRSRAYICIYIYIYITYIRMCTNKLDTSKPMAYSPSQTRIAYIYPYTWTHLYRHTHICADVCIQAKYLKVYGILSVWQIRRPFLQMYGTAKYHHAIQLYGIAENLLGLQRMQDGCSKCMTMPCAGMITFFCGTLGLAQLCSTQSCN